MKIIPVPRVRQLFIRMHPGDVLPDTLLKQLRERQVTGGWLRGSGVLNDVEMRAYSAEIDGPGGTKRLSGKVQAVTLEGALGVGDGDVAASLRAVLARETDRGLETLGGELVRAKVVGFEGYVVAFDELVLPRGMDPHAGVALTRDDAIPSTAPAREPPRPEPRPSAPPPAPHPGPAPARTEGGIDPVPPPRPSAPSVAGPLRPPKRVEEAEDGPYPQAGDIVEHFAFGTCEVLKSDGDRLHVKMLKDSRIREIALEMLRVTSLTNDGETQRYRLDRKL